MNVALPAEHVPGDTRHLSAGVGAFCSGPPDPHVSAQTKEFRLEI